jgi:hypothetical protein
MKVGDLVKIIRYGSRHAPNGTMGIIIERLESENPYRDLTSFRVHCHNGHIARQAHFCLEVISEGR